MRGAEAPAGPVFDPQRALGWRDVALDGLNCVLRCVEATLAHHGYTPQQIARCLAGELDLLGRDMAREFPGCALSWRTADGEGERNWQFVLDSVTAGTPVIIMPDRYYWPGDEFEGRFHFHDHAVLAYAWCEEEGVLTVLDTDAPPEDGFRRRLTESAQVRSACTRVAALDLTSPVDQRTGDEFGRAQIVTRTAPLASEAIALRHFFGALRENGLSGELGRGLHVLVLGDLQPLLFLFGEALTDAQDPQVLRVRQAALSAAAGAKRLGQALIAAHSQRDRQQGYQAALALADRLLNGVDSLVAAMRDAGGSVLGGPDPDNVTRALHAKLAAITETCFGEGAPA
ncbi:hypothetical protein ACI2L1_11780 [Streptomyces sp. NPDC019531]|uniref:hypothetical protein n=1 Tax=Streptomyces sp. NPDC019531 TaxID=3365062 RepID=UPI00384EB0C3